MVDDISLKEPMGWDELVLAQPSEGTQALKALGLFMILMPE